MRLGGMVVTAGADFYTYTAEYTGTTAVTSELKQLDIQLRLGVGLFGGSMGVRR
jgi:hypothetical protein